MGSLTYISYKLYSTQKDVEPVILLYFFVWDVTYYIKCKLAKLGI